jgi:hypothetical protein
MRVCMFGTYEAGYDRNQVLMRGMREAGIEVVECHVPLWETMRDKTSAFKGPAQYVVIAAKLALACVQLCFRYLLAPPHDIVLVGYLGHFDVFPARLSRRARTDSWCSTTASSRRCTGCPTSSMPRTSYVMIRRSCSRSWAEARPSPRARLQRTRSIRMNPQIEVRQHELMADCDCHRDRRHNPA